MESERHTPSTRIFLDKLKSLSVEFSALPENLVMLSLQEAWVAIAGRLTLEPLELAEKIAAACDIKAENDLFETDLELVARVPKKSAMTTRFIPLRKEGNEIIVAAANPFDPSVEQVAHFSLQAAIRCHIAPPDAIELALARAYAAIDERKQLASKQAPELQGGIPKLAAELMRRALDQHASDMHVQPFIGGSVVRIRVDGLLRRLVLIPDAVADSLVRYFKANSHMDPTNHMIPQDGRMEIEHEERKVDLRVSTLPLNHNREKLVVRFLMSAANYSLATTGLSLQEMHILRNMAANPSGVVLLCGPTGSGKTTTLYSILAELNKEDVSITTIENPVEYSFPGMSQTEINEAAGMTFSKALRSILRQDPDIILVGEIRDEETAQIAMQAALTGHLLFSTLHTNSALGAIPRLLDLGVLPVILSQALAGLVSQRLLRKLCHHCHEKVSTAELPDEVMFEQVTHTLPGFRAAGCEQCNYTGYLGRVVITEMVEINLAMADLISKNVQDVDELKKAAGSHYNTMSDVAARRIISGETTTSEAVRVLGRQFWFELAEEYGTTIPDLTDPTSSGGVNKKQTPVLLMGEDSAYPEKWTSTLEQSWIQSFKAHSPEESSDMLKANTNIALVILDLPNKSSDEDLLKYVAEFRTHIAWSRLPALVLLPEGRPELEGILRDHGATSRMLEKPVEPEEVARIIHKAISDEVDFHWGLKETIN